VGDDGNALDAMLRLDEADRRFQLTARVCCATERSIVSRRERHLGIGVREAEAMKIKPPDVEARVT
jgi:hypothetical protein